MLRGKIEEDGKMVLDIELKPKTYKSGKSGFYSGVNLVINGEMYKGNIMVYKANK